MKALETRWNGYRFRSRTEARWAVALYHAGITFEYERQGFELRSGYYLPDFWLPGRGFWVEVKGQDPNRRDVTLAAEMVEAGHDVRFAIGAPRDTDQTLLRVSSGRTLTPARLRLTESALACARSERFTSPQVLTSGAKRATAPEGWDERNPTMSLLMVMARKRRQIASGQ